MINKIESLFCFLIIILFLSGKLVAQPDNEKTKLLILGTAHLDQMKEFEPVMLERLIYKLDSESFDAVCIENMPAELLYDIRSRNDSAFAQIISSFGGTRLLVADSVQKQLGISFMDAQENVCDLSEKESLSDMDQLLMIEYFLAAADPVSATLHYSRLKDKTSTSKSKLSQKIFDDLNSNLDQANEIYSLALKLADHQNLNKVEYIDDFQDEALLLKHFPGFIQDFTDNQEAFKDIGTLPVFVNGDKILRQCIAKKDLLDHYLYLNSEEYMEQDFEAQWEIWLTTNFPSGTDRARYYLWEMRNLQIAANIMKVCSFYPGKKVIVIIGSAHKSFIEKYLRQVSDLEIINFE